VIGQSGAGNVISGNDADGVQITGASANGNTVRGNLIGTNAGGTAALPNGLMGVRIADAPGNTIGGTGTGDRNVISGHSGGGTGVLIQDGGTGLTNGNEVLGNRIGTNASGNAAIPNSTGVRISSPADGNFIGGTSPGAGNLISGNLDGVVIQSASNVVQGNFIGTNAAGTAALGNGFFGVDMSTINAVNNTVGGTAQGAGNVIAANGNAGINVGGTHNLMEGNFIGTDISTSADLGNGGHGIQASGTGHTFGGVVSGAGNVIAFNGFDGVSVGGSGTSINGNRIFANDQLGIDLFPPNGVDTNDPQDPDGGGNNGQNYPVVTGATTASSSSTIVGTLNSLPNTAFRIEFFNSPSCDPSNNGEGSVFLGATTVATDGSGNASFLKMFSVGLPSQSVATLTATRLDSGAPTDTSEFSRCRRVLRFRSQPSPTPSPSPTEPP
jgi:titin